MLDINRKKYQASHSLSAIAELLVSLVYIRKTSVLSQICFLALGCIVCIDIVVPHVHGENKVRLSVFKSAFMFNLKLDFVVYIRLEC